MTRTVLVAAAVARRDLARAVRTPSLLVPALLFPTVFLIAYAAGLSSLSTIADFEAPGDYTAFAFVLVLLQGAAFSGIYTGFAIAADWESGFARRLLLATPHRTGLLLGYVAATIVRTIATSAMLTAEVAVAGMPIDGNALQLAALVVLTLAVGAIGCLWCAGVAIRFKTLRAGPLIQMPITFAFLLVPAYVPLFLLTGWIHDAASWNPLTPIVEAGRGFLSGAPDHSGAAFACAAGLLAAMSAWAASGLRRATRGE